MKTMKNAKPGAASVKGKDKPPKRPAPPVPAPRNTQSAVDTGKVTAIADKSTKPSTSVSDLKINEMNQEILRYRTNLREKSNGNSNLEAQKINSPTTSNFEHLDSVKRELRDVVEKNTQWQIYNEQREEYVKDLIEKYNQLHHRFHHVHESYTLLTNNPDKLSDQQRRHFDGLLIQARQELGTSREETTKLKLQVDNMQSKFAEETRKLQEEIDHWRAMYEQEKEISDKLREERDRLAKRKSDSNDANKENRTRISSLHREMETYREEFRSERKRREDLEKRLDSLQKRMKDSEISARKKHELHSSRRHNDTHVAPNSSHKDFNDTVSPPKLKKISTKEERLPRSHKERRSHPIEPVHVTTRSRRAKDYRNHEETQDTLCTSDRMNRTYSEFGHSEDSNLRCPNCGKIYGVDEHEFLLVHIDSCM